MTNYEGKTQQELYKKTLDWINTIYNTPKEVIKGQIDNDYIRIEGSATELGANYQPAKYQIEISFKDGKYKFDVLNINQYVPGYQYIPSSWREFNINDTSNYYRKDGEIRNGYKYYSIAIPNYFNSLNKSLYDFIANEDTITKKNNW
ncbi:hypothetical protein D3C84_631900 [compost metagenome]